MSLFKERANNSKLVIALRNEIITYRNKIKELESSSSPDLTQELAQADLKLKECLDSCSNLKIELAESKAELKKIRSENTRLKKKVASLESSEDS